MTENRDRRSLSPEKREQLRRVIIELFADAPFQDVGLRDICARAGVTTRTVYKEFGNKDELLLAAIGPDLDVMSAGIGAIVDCDDDFERRARAIVRTYVNFFADNIPIARIFFQTLGNFYVISTTQYYRMLDIMRLREFILQGQAAGAFRNDCSVDDLIDASSAIASALIERALLNEEMAFGADALADRIWSLLRPMLLART